MAKIDLEPGERVIARDPPGWLPWAVFAFLVSPLVLMAGMGLWGGEEAPAERWDTYTIVIAIGFGNALLILPLLRWRLLVTDRRAIARSGLFLTGLDEMRLDEVREVQPLAFGLLLRGREREIHVRRFPFGPTPDTLMRILDPAYAATAATATGNGKIDGGLAPGETILKRSGKPWGVILQLAVVVGGFAALLLGISYDELLEEPSKILYLAGTLLVVATFFGGMAWFMVTARTDRWLLTDRRIRLARGALRSRIQEMMLDAVETARFNGDHLSLRGGEQAMDVRDVRIPATLLHNILPRQFPTGGERSAKLDSLLQPGEGLLMRHPGRWADWTSWITVVAVLGLSVLTLLIPSFYGKPLTGYHMVLVAVPALGMLGTLVENRHGSGWKVAVTDRRLLQCFTHDPAHYDEIETHRIRSIHRLPDKRGLSIRLDGREFGVVAEPKTADRILAALGRTAEAES